MITLRANRASVVPQAVKIYGERNTGTHYIERLVGKNFRVRILTGSPPMRTEDLQQATEGLKGKDRRLAWELLLDASMQSILSDSLGWKHGVPPFDLLSRDDNLLQSTLFIVITKHPLFWFKSMQKRPYHRLIGGPPADFSRFIRNPWLCMPKDNSRQSLLPSLVDLWNEKHAGYKRLLEMAPLAIHIQYEVLLADFEDQMRRLEEAGLTARTSGFQNIHTSAKGDTETNDDYRSKYALAQSKENWEDPDLRFVADTIDRDVLRYFQYEL